jgi:hemerythrin superfamily protein
MHFLHQGIDGASYAPDSAHQFDGTMRAGQMHRTVFFSGGHGATIVAPLLNPSTLKESEMAKNDSRSPDKSSSAASGQDAFSLLTADHKLVKSLFKEFDGLKDDGDDNQKAALVEKICNELKVHAQIEEEIFYPAVREAIEADDLMDEADVEHASAKQLIAQLEQLEVGADHYDATVTVLGEYIDHHVKEEEGEMFSKAREADIDGAALGEEMAVRKAELKEELGLEEDGPSSDKPAAPARKTKPSSSARK